MNSLENVYRHQLKYGCNGLNCSNFFCHPPNFLTQYFPNNQEREKEINRLANLLANTHNENSGHYLCKYLSPIATNQNIIQNIHEFNFHLIFKENPQKSDFDVFKKIFDDPNTFQFLLLANNNFYLSAYDLSLNDQKCDEFRMMLCSKSEYFSEFVPLFSKMIKEKFFNSKIKRTLHFLRGLLISTIFSQTVCNTVYMETFSILISMILKTDLILFCRQMSKMTRLLHNFVSVCHNAITILLIQDEDQVNTINRINRINTEYNHHVDRDCTDDTYLNDYYRNDALFFYENALSNNNAGRGNIRSDLLHNVCQILQNLSNMCSKNDIFIHEQLTSYLKVDEELKYYQEKKLFSFLYTPAVLTFEFRKKCYFRLNPINKSNVKVINIRRNRIMTDAAKLLSLSKNDLQGEIRFRFDGEEAIDFGGVRREFFALVGQHLNDLRRGVLRKISNEYLWFYPDFEEDISKGSTQQINGQNSIQPNYIQTNGNFSDSESYNTSPQNSSSSSDCEYSYDVHSIHRSLTYEQDYDIDDKIALSEVGNDWFKLLGILAGLCIRYQSEVILNVKFPILLYKSIIRKEITRIDLMEIYPDLITNLEKLSKYTNDEFDELDIRFSATTINHSIFDPSFPEQCYSSTPSSSCSSRSLDGYDHHCAQCIVNEDLIKNGCEIKVTEENVHEYINSYFSFLLRRLLNKKYSYFYSGFVRVVGDNLSQWFNPEELSLIVCGEEQFEWEDLVNNTTYNEGYTQESKTIFDFWDIFFNVFNQFERKKLLFFITGLRGSPIGGLKTVHLQIERSEDVNYLPTAHTCIMSLVLPDYNDRIVLENSLRVCLRNTEGFGFV